MFDASKLSVTWHDGAGPTGPLSPRRYTLTHSDRTGELFLAIGSTHDAAALATPQVRLMRDEVLGEWVYDEAGPRLVLTMAAQAPLGIFGSSTARIAVFRHYRPLVLAALRHAERELLAIHPELAAARVVARFTWRDGRVREEEWGAFGESVTGARAIER